MNYLLHYKKLIRKAKIRQVNNPLTCYKENHHIIPKCIGKHRNKSKQIINSKWNRVDLLPKEHFIAHLLLWKISKQFYNTNIQYKLYYPLLFMGKNSKFYDLIKQNHHMKCPENKLKISKSNKKRAMLGDLNFQKNNPMKNPIVAEKVAKQK